LVTARGKIANAKLLSTVLGIIKELAATVRERT
jgi:hypothetical protein